MYPQVSFGAWLQKRRRTLDLTQAELAQRAGCSISALRKIEADERRPSKQLAGLLADCLQIPPEDKSNFIKIARGELLLERLHIADSYPSVTSLLNPQSPYKQASFPVPATPLIGREPELAAIEGLLKDPQCRLLTLAGLGGMGKTRLAVEAAVKNQTTFPDGVCFIPLASLPSPEHIPYAIAEGLGLTIFNQADPKVQILNYLREKQVLLVLDNFEHLLEGVDLLVDLLQHAPQVKLLVTTRDRLNLQGEWVMEIQGLPVPDPAQPELAEKYSALQFFVQSALRARADFDINSSEKIWAIRICQLLQGMPLGIELAAAWVHTLSCRDIAQEIEHDLGFLSSRMRDIPERHRSLRTVLDHSWARLNPEEQRVLSRLSVFRGGFNRQAAEKLAEADLTILSILLARSLMQRISPDRYDLHELVRHYADEQIREAGERESIHQRHLEYYLDLARRAELEFEGPHLDEWRARVIQEGDNLRKALDWALKSDIELGLHLLSAISVMHEDIWLLGTERERRRWLEKALQAAASSPTPISVEARAKILFRAALLEPHPAKSRALLQESIDLAREAGDKRTLAYALSIASSYEYKASITDLGEAYFQESLSIFRELGSKFGEAHVLMIRGIVERMLGHYHDSMKLCESSLALAKELGHKHLAALNIANLTALALRMGDLSRAREYLDACQAHYLEVRNEFGMGDVFFQRARIAAIEGDYSTAIAFVEQSLEIGCEREIAALQCGNYLLLGDIAYYQGNLEAALMHYNTAQELVESAVGFGPPWTMKLLTLIGISMVAWIKGQYDHAVEKIEQVLSLVQTINDCWCYSLAHFTLGRVALSRHDFNQAEYHFYTSLSEMQKMGDKLGLARCMEGLAMVAGASGKKDQTLYSVRLFAAAADLRRSLNFPIPPVECREYERHLTNVRSRLDEAIFSKAWSEGQALIASGPDAAVNYIITSRKAPVIE